MLAENNVWQGFLEHGDFLKLVGCLPDHLRPLGGISVYERLAQR